MKYNLVLVLVFLAICGEAQTISRKAVLVKGQQFERTSDATAELEMNLMGKFEKSVNREVWTTAISVGQVLDTTYVLNSKVTHKTIKGSSANKSIDFDSNQPADTANQADWEKFIKGFGDLGQIVINKKGLIISRTDTTDADQGDAEFLPGWGKGADSSGIYEMIAQLPLKSIKPGEKWTDSIINKDSREFYHYTLTSLTATEGVIAIDETIDIDTEMPGENEKIKMKVQIIGTGSLTFDPKTGIIRKREDVLKGEGTLLLKGFTIPIKINGAYLLTFKRK